MAHRHRLLLLVCLTAAVGSQSCMGWADATKCAACNLYAGYAINPSGVCKLSPLSNCAEVSATGSCTKCVSGLPPVSGSCTASGSVTCVYLSSLSQCGICKLGNYPTASINCSAVKASSVVPNCAVYSSAQVCIKCLRNYTLSNNACVATSSHCVAASAPFVCDVCPDQTYPVLQVVNVNFWVKMFDLLNYGLPQKAIPPVCTKNPDPNCEKSASLTECAVCVRNFYLDANNQCVQGNVINLCAHLASQTVCKDCDPGYAWSGNACVVSPNDPLCIGYSSLTACSRCQTGYYVDQATNLCKPVNQPLIANCEVYSSNTSCYYCKQGYRLADNTCKLPVWDKCAQADASGACLYCAEGYKFSGTTCVAVADTGNCIRFGRDGKCARCSPYTALKPDGTCGFLFWGSCLFFNSKGQCLICRNGNLNKDFCSDGSYYTSSLPDCTSFLGGQCMSYDPRQQIAKCDGNDQYARSWNCLAQEGGFCVGCPNGYYPSTYGCEKYQEILGCRIQADWISCYVCQFYASATDQNCLDPAGRTLLPNCYSQIGADACKYCNEGFRWNAVSKACEAAATPANCMLVNPTNIAKCDFCKTGYTKDLQNGACLPAIEVPGCLTTSWLGCTRCADGFELSADSQYCVAETSPRPAICAAHRNGKCIFCDAGWIPTDSGECVRFAFSAPNYNCRASEFNGVDATTCVGCAENYAITSTGQCDCGYCDVVEVWIPGCKHHRYITITTGTPPNEETYQSKDCAECREGLDLSNGKCILRTVATQPGPARDDPCLHYDGWFNCAEYPMSYVTALGGINLTCDFGTKFQGCVAVNADFNCVACDTDYYLNNKRCVTRSTSTIPNCRIDSGSTCVKCISGFYLDNNNVCTATSAVPNCKDYDSDLTCSLCKQGFVLSGSGTACLTNCEIPGHTACDLCLPRFYLDASDVCVAVTDAGLIPNCRYFASDTVCTMCEQGFALMADGSCQAAAGYGQCKSLVQNPRECEVCAAGQVLGADGKCVAVASPITGCWMYDQGNPTRCQICKTGFSHTYTTGLCTALIGTLATRVSNYSATWIYL